MRTLLRLLVAAAAGFGILLAAAPAHAAIIDVDYFKLTENHVDFGEGRLHDISGRPTENGRLDWHLVGGELEPRLIGKIWLNNARDSCARIQMTFNWSGADVTYSDSTWCAPDGGTWFAYVDFAPFEDPTITSVTVKLQFKEDPGDPFVTVEQSTWVPS